MKRIKSLICKIKGHSPVTSIENTDATVEVGSNQYGQIGDGCLNVRESNLYINCSCEIITCKRCGVFISREVNPGKLVQ